tara:strand:+ start:324 stop:524 length:201 start_codon:yes stop_codon:yes gene_type:complete
LIHYSPGWKDARKYLVLKNLKVTTQRDCMRIWQKDIYLFGFKKIQSIDIILGNSWKNFEGRDGRVV